MRKPLRIAAMGVLLPWMLMLAAPTGSANNKYVENFDTKRYCDTLNTTAWWDTVAQELRLFPFAPTLAGGYDTPDLARGVAVSGDHAFVADGASGLVVLDITTPSSPVLAGSYNLADFARGVALSGDHAFVAFGNLGLVVIDITIPSSPGLAGTYNTTGYAWGVTVSGDHVFVADGTSGLQIINIKTPSSPVLTATYNTTGSAFDVVVSGNHAFVADGTSGLQVIDITNPSSPVLAGSYTTSSWAHGVAISGDRAFVAASIAGLVVVDITTPSSPVLAGTYDTAGESFDSAISGRHAFVADGVGGLQVIEISNPVAPEQAGSYNPSGGAVSVYVAGDYAFVTSQSPSALRVIDISNPAIPTPAGTYSTPGQGRWVDVAGDYAFVAVGTSGLQVIDISNPAAPTLAGSYDTPGGASCVHVAGDYAFVSDEGSGLQVIDVSDPATPTLAGSYDTPGWANAVWVSGDYALVADGQSGLEVIDISETAAPTLAGSYNTPGNAAGVYVSGDHAFVVELEPAPGLQVIDISNPAAPTLAGADTTSHGAAGVHVAGDYAFVTVGFVGLLVFDVSNPAVPMLAERYDILPFGASAVRVAGDQAFVAASATGLHVIQVFQSDVDEDKNVGRSLAVNSPSDTVLRTRLTTSQTNAVTWEVSVTGGSDWHGIEPNGRWTQLAFPGNDLRWRSTHAWAAPGVNPGVSQLEIDWLVAAAFVDSIVDVPDDQGGWVRAHFTRSGRDFSDEDWLPIDDYGIWQRVDNPALIAALEAVSASEAGKRADGQRPHLVGVTVIDHQGRRYVQSRPGLAASSSFPPGTWEWVATVPAVQQDAYVARVPTTADSSASGPNHAVYVITAHTTTPSIWYVSDPDSGYSVDNIAPGVPQGFAVAYNTGSGNQLSWDPAPEPDFQYFKIYRGADPDFVPGPGNLVHATAVTQWSDPEYDGWDVHYKITAVDHAGNESNAATPGTATAITEPSIPQTFALHQNVPNPFNPTTVIRYDVPAGGERVTLRVYDVAGRLVRTLVDGEQTAGEKRVTWDGRNAHGGQVATGVYFYRMKTSGFEMTRKMVMLQ